MAQPQYPQHIHTRSPRATIGTPLASGRSLGARKHKTLAMALGAAAMKRLDHPSMLKSLGINGILPSGS